MNFFQVNALLDQGADINKKTSTGSFPLYLALHSKNTSLIELLLRRGAKVNETTDTGRTCLHEACSMSRPDVVRMLLDHGADPNILDNEGRTPLTGACTCDQGTQDCLVKELAISKHHKHCINPENMAHLRQTKNLLDLFFECLNELKSLDENKFYNGYSLSDILQMRGDRKKLLSLIKDEEFVVRFKACWYGKSYKHYGDILNKVFENAINSRHIMDSEESRLLPLLKDVLPTLLIRKIAYFLMDLLYCMIE